MEYNPNVQFGLEQLMALLQQANIGAPVVGAINAVGNPVISGMTNAPASVAQPVPMNPQLRGHIIDALAQEVAPGPYPAIGEGAGLIPVVPENYRPIPAPTPWPK